MPKYTLRGVGIEFVITVSPKITALIHEDFVWVNNSVVLEIDQKTWFKKRNFFALRLYVVGNRSADSNVHLLINP